MDSSRRKFLAATGVAGLSSLSGCLRGSVVRGVARGISRALSDESDTERTTPTPTAHNEDVSYDWDDEESDHLHVDNIGPLYSIGTEVDIEPGSYYYWELELSNESIADYVEFEYEAIVRIGPNINILLLDSSEFAPYRLGQSFLYYEEISSVDTGWETGSTGLELRDYIFLLENQNRRSSSYVDIDFTVERP